MIKRYKAKKKHWNKNPKQTCNRYVLATRKLVAGKQTAVYIA